jgi:small GTP-binding protein
MVFRNDEFPPDYVPGVFGNCVIDLTVDDKDIELELNYAAGQEEYDRLRPLSYPGSDVILVCYSVDSPNSYDNVKERWIPEVEQFCPRVPVVIVGTERLLP